MDWVDPARLEPYDNDMYPARVLDDLRRRIAVIAATSKRLRISSRELSREALVVALAGELDVDTTPQLTTILRNGSLTGVRFLIIDLSQLTFIDSTGINTFLQIAKRVAEEGGALTLAAPSKHIARVFEIVRLHETIEITESLNVEGLSGGGPTVLGPSWRQGASGDDPVGGGALDAA